MTEIDPNPCLDKASISSASVVVIDDEKLICDLVRTAIAEQAQFVWGGSALNPSDARHLVATVQPDIIIIDGVDFYNWIPDRLDPIAFIEELVKLSPSSYVFVFTHWNPAVGPMSHTHLLVRALNAGAEALVLKGDGFAPLLRVISDTLRRGAPPRQHEETVLFTLLRDMIVDETSPTPVPADELKPKVKARIPSTVRGLEAGLTVEHIAELLSVSVHTLNGDLRAIYASWNVSNQVQFVAAAHRRGYL